MSRKNDFKRDKMQERILNDLNSLLRFSVHDDRLRFVTITRVDLNVDYSKAEIFWDTYSTENKETATEAISENKSKLRKELARVLRIRAVPELDFHYDSQFEDEQKITNLLNEVKTDSQTQDD